MMRIGTVSWLWGAIFFALTSGVSFKNYALMLGFGNFGIGLLTMIPFLATLCQPVAAYMTEGSGLRKYVFLICGSASRLCWLGVAAIPFVMPTGMPSLIAMLLVYGFGNVMGAFANPAWVTWMGDLLPRRIRGRYMAARLGFGRLIQVGVVIAMSLTLDWATVQGAPETAGAQPRLLHVISLIFLISAIFGVSEILMYRRVREVLPRVAVVRGLRLGQDLRRLFAAPGFVQFIGHGATVTFAGAVAGLFFWRYTTEGLGFSKLGANFLYLVVSPILGLAGLKVWGRLVDRWGRRPVLVMGTVMTVFSVMPYFFATPDGPYPAFIADALNGVARFAGQVCNWVAGVAGAWSGHGGWGVGDGDWRWIVPGKTPLNGYLLVALSCFIGGIGWTGINMAQTNIMMNFADGEGRSKHVAIAQALLAVGGVVGGLAGGWAASMLEYYQYNPLHVGPFIWYNWHATFALSCVARVLALLWLIGMPDPGAGKVGEVVRYVGLAAYTNVATWALYPLRLLGNTRKRR
jgi:MFS family permease